MAAARTFYEILGVATNASGEVGSCLVVFTGPCLCFDPENRIIVCAVRKAYKVKILETHPGEYQMGKSED